MVAGKLNRAAQGLVGEEGVETEVLKVEEVEGEVEREARALGLPLAAARTTIVVISVLV